MLAEIVLDRIPSATSQSHRAPEPRQIRIPTKAGFLAGQVFEAGGPIRNAIVIHPATGVPQRRYEKFARWVAAHEQAAVLIYDYRDMGRSDPKHPRQSRVTMSDWGIEDQSAALDWLCEDYPDRPVTVIGHSLGGMCVPWHRQADAVSRIIAIASGPAYVTRHPLSFMPAVIWFWYVGGPLLTRLFGYLPGKLVGLGTDLPAGVFWQWRRWCTSKRFNRDRLGHGDAGTGPIPHQGGCDADRLQR